MRKTAMREAFEACFLGQHGDHPLSFHIRHSKAGLIFPKRRYRGKR